jgi:hypothetical protein
MLLGTGKVFTNQTTQQKVYFFRVMFDRVNLYLNQRLVKKLNRMAISIQSELLDCYEINIKSCS